MKENIRELSGVPVIFLFAYGRDEIVANVLGAGTKDHIVRTFSPTGLVARIQTVLRKGMAAQEPEPCESGDDPHCAL